jgi:phage terminase small subunit
MPILSNPNHERFALEHVKDRNAGRAYVRTGYSEKGADQSA